MSISDDEVEAALAFWCTKLPKAQRERPIPQLLRDHMRGTLEAAAKVRAIREGDGVQQMHRRAQHAEGRIEAAMYDLETWDKTFFPGRPGEPFARLIIDSVRRALAARFPATGEGE